MTPGGKSSLDIKNLGPGVCGPFSFSLRAQEGHFSLIMNECGDGYQEPVKPEVRTFSKEAWRSCFQGQMTVRLPCSCHEEKPMRAHLLRIRTGCLGCINHCNAVYF